VVGIRECCAYVIRRCRAVTKLGPGGVQKRAADVIAILRESSWSGDIISATSDNLRSVAAEMPRWRDL
jgi:hypothetical protein